MADDELGGWGAFVQEQDAMDAERSQAASEREARPDEWRNVWVYAEVRDDHVRSSVYELIGKARELADALGVRVETFLAGTGDVDRHAQALIKAGADAVYIAKSPLHARQDPDAVHASLVHHVRRRRPELLLFGQNTFNDALAARLAVTLDTGCVTRVSGIRLETSERLFVFDQVGYGGRLERSSWIPKAKPQVATVLRRSFTRPLPDPTRTGQVIDVMTELGHEDLRLQVVGEAPEPAGLPLSQAPAVVLCGKGIGSKEGYAAAGRLTEIIHDCQMATTRSSVDLGFGPADRLVGIHGIRIAPRLLITLGVSGDLDTLEGIDTDRVSTWVAVDRDPESPILAMADIAVVSDWEPFIDALVETLKAEKRALTF
ncbi:MAG: electron transfer flavoprotein subunit alpha/FixB family protein [Euryarchaeota archaeon]|nr:electron transfer flavoprotein subunit alpha/FixB family protein [Euryarchaeota archaeon]